MKSQCQHRQNVLSYGDQWTDHTALQKAAAGLESQSHIKTVKAHCTEEGLTPGSLAQELQLVGRMLPYLAALENGCSYDLDDPETRCTLEFPIESGDSRSSASPRRLSSLYRMVAATLTPSSRTPTSPLSTSSSPAIGSRSDSIATDTESNAYRVQETDATRARSSVPLIIEF